jgi:hypothetical protein
MRLALPIALLACAVAHADVSLDARAVGPHTPLGPACDAALAAAQVRFSELSGEAHFQVREQRVVGEYRWSDMCGVWGDYSVELAPDRRAAPDAWQWSETRRDEPDYSIHRRGVRRANGWRARFILDGDNGSAPGDSFVQAFQPAVDTCLASAALPR